MQKNVGEKATKGCLETTEVLLDADLHKFDIYQGTVSPNYFNCFKILDVLIFVLKKGFA